MDDHRDLSLEEQLAIDVPALLAEGIGDGSGGIRGVVQGVAVTATALQVEATGMPTDMLGRMLTMVNRHTFRAARDDVDVIVEEPERRGFPGVAAIVRAGIAACRDEAEYALFARWLADVYGLLALREATAAAEPDAPPA
jgi:hypothetical protein